MWAYLAICRAETNLFKFKLFDWSFQSLDRTIRRTVFYRIYGPKPYKYGCTPYFRTVPYNRTPYRTPCWHSPGRHTVPEGLGPWDVAGGAGERLSLCVCADVCRPVLLGPENPARVERTTACPYIFARYFLFYLVFYSLKPTSSNLNWATFFMTFFLKTIFK